MIVKRTLVSSDMRVFDYMFSNGILQRYKNLNASVQNLVTRSARNNDSSNPYLLLSKKKTDIRADVCFLLAEV